ncbi:P-loop containing nucleoside triphosphate hydrolase protein [Fusarium sp. MPI-SDFR-AT-0072]|nr:P-loop containing nucleoside triphosphate hydrolase protein [Fusarium sp. MPI-SDFR-AT-0072]
MCHDPRSIFRGAPAVDWDLQIPQQLLGTTVSSLRARHEREGSRIPSILREKFEEHSGYRRPASPDCLFLSTYDHVPQTSAYDECDHSKLVRRRIRETDDPLIHYGAIASGNQVMRSGTQRDSIARQLDVICFEMEAAGLMDILPCLPIRGICDYSDSHKNKEWQRYAAAAAASYARELLTVLPVTEARVKATYMPNPYRDLSNGSQLNPAFSSIRRFADKASSVMNSRQKSLKTCHFMVPFGRNKGFVGRKSILDELLKKVPPVVDEDDCQRTAIEGLGGVGKTQIALEAAHRVHDTHPDCSVFWVPAIDAASFENAYREIGQRLEISGIDDEKADIKTMVKVALSQENAGTWLLIIDNADDVQLLLSNPALCDHLPFGRNGSILFTTRNHDVTGRLDIRRKDVITAAEMDRVESIALLQQDLKEAQTCDNESMTTLLDFLADLPLAIRQASSFMGKTGITTTAYLNHCQASDKTLIKLLSRNFEDRNRYKASDNPVAATWLISFEHISRDMPLAVHYLKFMCFLAEKDIPVSLLPPADDEIDADEAIGTLKAYAFISKRDGSSSFDIHRLVQLSVRNWLEEKGERGAFIKTVIQRLAEAFLSPKHENRGVWMQYLPHAQTALAFRKYCPDEEAKRSLLFGVGASNMILGKYMEAEQIYRQALDLTKGALGPEHPDTLTSMNNLATLLCNQGKYEEAERIYLTWLLKSRERLPQEQRGKLEQGLSWQSGRY